MTGLKNGSHKDWQLCRTAVYINKEGKKKKVYLLCQCIRC